MHVLDVSRQANHFLDRFTVRNAKFSCGLKIQSRFLLQVFVIRMCTYLIERILQQYLISIVPAIVWLHISGKKTNATIY